MKPKHVYEIDGQLTGALILCAEAHRHGISTAVLHNRLARGDRTRARLFRPVGPCHSAKRVQDAAEVAAAIAALDSRPRLWTGY